MGTFGIFASGLAIGIGHKKRKPSITAYREMVNKEESDEMESEKTCTIKNTGFGSLICLYVLIVFAITFLAGIRFATLTAHRGALRDVTAFPNECLPWTELEDPICGCTRIV